MTYNLFIGRYQSPHKGHQAIFNRYLDNNEPIMIAIRDMKTDANNPLTAKEVASIWKKIYSKNNLVKIIIIPDIKSVNYGRGVGYEVLEIEVDKNLQNISATEIRKQIRSGEKEWKNIVDVKAHKILEKLLKNEREILSDKKIVGFVYNYKTKYKEGFTDKEIQHLLVKLGKFGIDIGSVYKNLSDNYLPDPLTHKRDVEQAIRLVAERQRKGDILTES